MKKILMALSIIVGMNSIFAEISEKSVILRGNIIYVDEVLGEINEGDSGIGSTVEISLLFSKAYNVNHAIGFEAGYIKSDVDGESLGVDFEANTELIPVFVNYTIGANFGDDANDASGFIWEAGLGLGGFFADVEQEVNASSENGDDFIFGGQVFGRIGYRFAESVGVLLGARYMTAEDGRFSYSRDFGNEIEGEVINSFAIDFSINYTF